MGGLTNLDFDSVEIDFIGSWGVLGYVLFGC